VTAPAAPSLLVPVVAGAAQALVFINHAPLLPLIMPELEMTPAQAGLLSTATFGAGGLVALPVGALTDRIGPRRVMSLCLALFTLTAVALGLAPGYATMLLARLVSGAGVTGVFIAGSTYVARLWPGPREYLAQGLFGGATQLGIGAAIFGLPWVAASAGWRAALVLCALPVTLAWLLWHRAAAPVPGTGPSRRASARPFGDPVVWQLALVNAAGFGLNVVIGGWITVYFVQEFALPLTLAGTFGSLPVLIGMVARPLGGVLSARGTLGPRTVILTTLAGTIGALVLLAWPGRPVAAAIAALVVAGVMTTLSYPASIALVGRVQPQAAGAALGVIATVSPAAVVVGAPLTGALLSLTGDFTVPFLALAALPLAALVWGFALPRD
jgi:NNP family nitrate/nitrite transporter-like MFS transporter